MRIVAPEARAVNWNGYMWLRTPVGLASIPRACHVEVIGL
jgi:hypothetical protein